MWGQFGPETYQGLAAMPILQERGRHYDSCFVSMPHSYERLERTWSGKSNSEGVPMVGKCSWIPVGDVEA